MSYSSSRLLSSTSETTTLGLRYPPSETTMRRRLSYPALRTYSTSKTSIHLSSSRLTRSALFLGLMSPTLAANLAQTEKFSGDES